MLAGTGNIVWLDNQDPWSIAALAGDLVITEVLSFGTTVPTEEFVEIHNSDGVPVDVTGFRLADRDVLRDPVEDLDYVVPAADHWGTASTLLPGEHAVVWLSYDGVTLPPVTNPPSGLEFVIANPGQSLDNTGDTVWLLDDAGALVDDMAYLSRPTTPRRPGSGTTRCTSPR